MRRTTYFGVVVFFVLVVSFSFVFCFFLYCLNLSQIQETMTSLLVEDCFSFNKNNKLFVFLHTQERSKLRIRICQLVRYQCPILFHVICVRLRLQFKKKICCRCQSKKLKCWHIIVTSVKTNLTCNLKLYQNIKGQPQPAVKHSFLYDVIATSSHEGHTKKTPIEKCCTHVFHIHQLSNEYIKKFHVYRIKPARKALLIMLQTGGKRP